MREGSEREPRAPQPEDAPEVPAETELGRRMHEGFANLEGLHDAVVQGDVAEVRRHGAALRVQTPVASQPESWRSYLRELDATAAGLAEAEDLAAAATGTSRMAVHCAECHVGLGVVLALPPAPAPPRGEPPHELIPLHGWSAARLLEGLVTPSEERWLQGTATIAALPVCDDTVRGAQARRAKCLEARGLAGQAHVAQSLAAKGTVYGKLLQTCAGCHAMAPSNPEAG